MTAADPTRDRTLPEAEEQAPSAIVPGAPCLRIAVPRGAHRAARARPAQGRPASPRGRVAHRQADRRTGGLTGPGRRLPDHRAGPAPAGHRPLAQGGRARPDAAAGPPPAREDHPLRPRADPRARGARPRRGRARRVPRPTATRRRSPVPASSPRTSTTPVFVRFSTVLGSRGSADTVRDTRGFATKFYTDEGTFDLVGNNMPVFFIQDAHQVPRRHPRRQAAPGPRDPAGPERPRHLLGLRLAAHRGHPPRVLEHVRPGHPALLPDDGGLRRPHLPAVQRRGRDHRW